MNSKYVYLLGLLLWTGFFSNLASQAIGNASFRKVVIRVSNPSERLRGVIYNVNDKEVTLVKIGDLKKKDQQDFNFTSIPVQRIKTIELKPVRKINTGFIVGSAVGFTIGAAMVLSPGHRSRRSADSQLQFNFKSSGGTNGGIMFVTAGIGGLIGSAFHKKHEILLINQKFENFQTHRERLLEIAIQKTVAPAQDDTIS